jgi:hypothetical protein
MKVLLRIQPRPPELLQPEPLLFRGMTMGRSPKPGSLAGSVAAHVLAICLATVLCNSLARLHDDDVDWSRFRAEPLRLHLSEPLTFNAAASGKPQKPLLKPAPQSAVRPAQRASGTAALSYAPAVPRRLELPPSQQPALNAPLILQPDFQLQPKAPPVELPPMAFWARKAPELVKPPSPTDVVVPGRTEAPSPAPKLAAQPVLEVPNREPAVADVNVSMPQNSKQTPAALPVPNSATMPVRLRDASESQAASFERFAGQPVNVMSLASERSDIRNVTIPKGLQNIPRAAAGENPGTSGEGYRAPDLAPENGPTSGNRAAGAAGTNRGGPIAATSQTSSAPITRQTTAPVSGSGSGDSPPVRNSSSGAEEHPVAVPAGSPEVLARGGAPPGVTRIDHPVDGSFDVVVTQSASRDDLSELGGILSGNPVYSVYLRVGDQKEWLLEYCVPARRNVQPNPYQIDVDDAGSITPPYPISTVIPNSVLVQPITRHIVLHGVLTAAGNLQSVKAADSSSPLMSEILALLSQWQFRPALRNRRPIDVEVLLVIPRHS